MQDVNVNDVKGDTMVFPQHYQQRNNVTKEMASNEMKDYKHTIQLSINY